MLLLSIYFCLSIWFESGERQNVPGNSGTDLGLVCLKGRIDSNDSRCLALQMQIQNQHWSMTHIRSPCFFASEVNSSLKGWLIHVVFSFFPFPLRVVGTLVQCVICTMWFQCPMLHKSTIDLFYKFKKCNSDFTLRIYKHRLGNFW